MNALMNVGEVQTMSSREIAELTGKEHKNVIRDIRAIIEQLKDGSDLSHDEFQQVTDNRGYTAEYLLTKNQTLLLMTGYSVPLRQRLINRWRELEEQVNKPALPQTYLEALKALVAAEEEKERLSLENKEMAPKADIYDKIVDKNNLYIATHVGQKVKMSAKKLNQYLDTLNVYNRSVKRCRTFQQWFVDAGYGIMRETTTGHSQAMFTAEGEMWVVKTFMERGNV